MTREEYIYHRSNFDITPEMLYEYYIDNNKKEWYLDFDTFKDIHDEWREKVNLGLFFDTDNKTKTQLSQLVNKIRKYLDNKFHIMEVYKEIEEIQKTKKLITII